jgi:hypothetical protein
LHKNISVITLKPQGLVYFFYIKFGRSGVFTAGNDIGDFLQAAMAKDDIARPRNPVILTATFQSPLKIADRGSGSENWTGGPSFLRADAVAGSDRRVAEFVFVQEEMIAVWLRRARRSAAV